MNGQWELYLKLVILAMSKFSVFGVKRIWQVLMYTYLEGPSSISNLASLAKFAKIKNTSLKDLT